MLNNRSELEIETFSFSSFIDSWEEISVFSAYTQSTEDDPTTYVEYSKLIPTMKIAHSIATKLTVVYLVAIAEAYFTDVLMELIDRRVKEINRLLMGSPVPSNEEEDIAIEVNLAEVEDDTGNAFHIFSTTTRDYVKHKMRQNTLKESLGLLKSLFGIEIQDRGIHLKKWDTLKALRNSIVHHRAYSKDKFLFTANQCHTISDISISPDEIKHALYDVFELSYAIESGICKSLSNSNPHHLFL